MHSEGYSSWVCVSVCLLPLQLTSRWFVPPTNDSTYPTGNENQFKSFLSVCHHIFCHYAQHGDPKVIPTGSVPHWLDEENGDLRTITTFKSYGMKTK